MNRKLEEIISTVKDLTRDMNELSLQIDRILCVGKPCEDGVMSLDENIRYTAHSALQELSALHVNLKIKLKGLKDGMQIDSNR